MRPLLGRPDRLFTMGRYHGAAYLGQARGLIAWWPFSSKRCNLEYAWDESYQIESTRYDLDGSASMVESWTADEGGRDETGVGGGIWNYYPRRDVRGKVPYFGGSINYQFSGDNLNLAASAPFTFSALIKLEDSGNDRTVVSSGSNTGGGKDYFALEIVNATQPAASAYDGTTLGQARGTASVPDSDNCWVRLTAVFKGTASREIWQNAGLVATDTTSVTPANCGDRFRIGGRGNKNGSNWWLGKMADVRVYNRGLVRHEIVDIFLNPWKLHASLLKTYVPEVAAVTTKNYYTGGFANPKRLTRGLGF